MWAGVYPEAPHIPLRVEAGKLDGRPVYFRLGGPWEGPAGAAGDGEAAPEPMFRKAPHRRHCPLAFGVYAATRPILRAERAG